MRQLGHHFVGTHRVVHHRGNRFRALSRIKNDSQGVVQIGLNASGVAK
jgi:hypothetical protein